MKFRKLATNFISDICFVISFPQTPYPLSFCLSVHNFIFFQIENERFTSFFFFSPFGSFFFYIWQLLVENRRFIRKYSWRRKKQFKKKKKNRKGRKYFQTRKKNFFRIYGNVNLIMTGSWNVGIRFSCIVFPIYDRETGCDQRQLRCWLWEFW